MLDAEQGVDGASVALDKMAKYSDDILREKYYAFSFRGIIYVRMEGDIAEVIDNHSDRFEFTFFNASGEVIKDNRKAVAALVEKQRYEEEDQPVVGELYYLDESRWSEVA